MGFGFPMIFNGANQVADLQLNIQEIALLG